MKTSKLLVLALLCLPLTACLGDDDPAQMKSAALTSPVVGTWFSANGSTPAQVRANVAVSGQGFSMVISDAANPTQPTYVVTGTVDLDGRHFNDPIVVNGVPRHCYGFATADGSRMFFGIQDDSHTYMASWTFLRTQ
jgi:hypothetical protein